MRAEFEEKEYEAHANSQLAEESKLVYPPGQVTEKVLGFDASLGVGKENYFWEAADETYRSGTQIDEDWWEQLDESVDEKFPPFRYNLFVQYKRPECMVKASAREWGEWGESYFRYRITEHQQDALENLEENMGDEGVVYYASPAFYEKKALWESLEEQDLIERTNFAQPSKVTEHDVYTYSESGSGGIGFSDPEPVKSTPFETSLANLSAVEASGSNRDFLIRLGDQVHEAALSVNGEKFRSLYQEINEHLVPESIGSDIPTALTRVDAFRFLTDTTLLIGVAE
ncbi:hypothetical protein [Salinibacter ruber]|uniref:hypothetical protein n=1 Tax=Salinibacter ruber TaxID=146919 RepID=UPI002168C601|nr:hypothetical protein [Salinibacter ruber]MCS4174579.1 hypothetical protein [Salinibacter ruber]